MKKILFLFLLTFLLISCKDNEKIESARNGIKEFFTKPHELRKMVNGNSERFAGSFFLFGGYISGENEPNVTRCHCSNTLNVALN